MLATPNLSPAIRSANIQRSPPPARSLSPTRRAFCVCVARRCRRPFRSGKARWRRSSARNSIRRAQIAAEAAKTAGAVCQVANDNGGGQVVLSGAKTAVEKAIDLSKEKGIKRAVLLPVSAPFHCSLMQPAAEAMREALAQTRISVPRAPVVANVTARPVTEP